MIIVEKFQETDIIFYSQSSKRYWLNMSLCQKNGLLKLLMD